MANRKASGTLQSPNSVLGHALDIEHSLGRLSVGSQGVSEWAAETHFTSSAGLNPSAGCWQPPASLLIYPHSPVSPYRVPAGVPAYAGWQWQSQLPPPSPQPTRSVVTIARAGGCLSESRLRHVVGGNGSVRAITAIDQHGHCSVVSFYDVRSAVAFFDAITKDPAVEQAFFIMPPLNGPGMDNQGVLAVSLGAATVAQQQPLPDPQQQADVREAAEAFGAVEDVCQEAGDGGAGRHWRVCFADTRDAETAKHGLEGLEIAGRPAHIEFWAPPGAAYLPMPMVAPPPAPPPQPPSGWSSAPIAAAPSSPSAYMGIFPAPSPSYGSYSPGSGQAGSGEYVAVGYQPVALSRSNSADYGMGLGGGVMAAFSWAPYGGSYPMYPGMNVMTGISPGSPTHNGSMRSASADSPYSSGGGGPVFREPSSRLSPGRSPRSWSRTNRSNRAEFDVAAYAFDPVEGRKPGARTTLMIRNIPNKYTQAMLLDILEDLCSGKYDFFYLPIDYKNKCNLGYAFVNFTEPEAAAVFFMERHQQRWQEFNSKKVCEVTYARVQGQQALVDHFRNSKFPCADADSLPLIFRPPSPTSQGEEKATKWSTATKMVAVPITQLITPSSNSARADAGAAAADG